jgi:hypothetical protein
MPSKIKPTTIKNIYTQNGECKIEISLEIDINVNSDGVNVGVTPKTQSESPQEEKVDWAIPDFGNSPKIKFGKNS